MRRVPKDSRPAGGHRDPSSTHERIFAVVRRIPRGRVATYGQVALLAGLPRQARLVGYALHALPAGTPVPWHRVINAAGRVSPRTGDPAGGTLQRIRLEVEGVRFDARGRVDLERHGWTPRAAAGRSRPSKSKRSSHER